MGNDAASHWGQAIEFPIPAEARTVLYGMASYSFHMVLADASGEIGAQQVVGAVPRRGAPEAALYPTLGWTLDADMPVTLWPPASLPYSDDDGDGAVISANEARPAADMTALANMAQPPYRRQRIATLLAQQPKHDVASMQAMQLDVQSLQARSLVPRFLTALPPGHQRTALAAWDGTYESDSHGAHAFSLAYHAALQALAPWLGGDAWQRALHDTEVLVWWCVSTRQAAGHLAFRDLISIDGWKKTAA